MAGAGYKLFATGDVLTAAEVNTYLMQQAVMVFDDSAARTTALSGVVAEGMLSYLKDTNAVEVYDGSGWVASDDPNAIQNSIVDAKGDLISASADNVPARLAVGNDGESIVADSSTSTGLAYREDYAAGKNKIINGDFSVNQRAFSSTSTPDQYGFDRWIAPFSGATATYSAQTFTLGAAPVAGYESKNFARLAVTTGNDFCRLEQRIEDVRNFAGQTITISFYAKGTNPTTAGNLSVAATQFFGTGGSPSATVTTAAGTFVLTANWTRYSLTVAVPSISGKTLGTNNDSSLQIRFGQEASASTDAWTLDLWGVQLEAGSVATAFQTATGTLAGELAACQRYFQRRINSVATPEETVGVAQNFSTTQAFGSLNWINTMRVAPTVSVSAVTDYAIRNATAGVVTLTAFTFDRISTNQCRFNTTVASGQVAGNAGLVAAIFANSATLDASAEL